LLSTEDTTGETLSVKVSKILAGQEPEKTNEMLQSLAKAIAKSEGSGETVKDTKPLKGAPVKDAKKPAAKPTTKPDATAKATTGGKNTSQAANKSKGADKPKVRGQDASKSTTGKDDNLPSANKLE